MIVRSTRRGGLEIAWAAAVAVSFFVVSAAAAEPTPRPNILYLCTDQQQAGMMSCAGNPWVKTPAMDSLAATGTRFERAYASNPVCLPSRVTMMTGHYPSRFGIEHNGDGRKGMPEEALPQALGWLFRGAGYRTAYGGKTHWPRGMTAESIGFEMLTGNSRDALADACAEFLRDKHEKPFLLVASLINPHDICYMAIDDHARSLGREPLYSGARVERERLAAALAIPDGVSREEFFARLCPPLPDNYEVPALEPERIDAYLLQRPFKKYAREHWSDERWREHRWAYCRLTEMVDAQVGVILDALREAGLEESTLVVLASDHGDMDASHRMEHKTVFYEEASRVPLVVSFKGVTEPGLVDRTHLVSAGTDLLPTLCDYAGIDPPEGLPGRSVRALAEGRAVADWRDQLVVESELGRMVRTDRWKYNLYESGAHREQLVDLQSDPGEMKNLAEDPAYADVLDEHRGRMQRWIDATGDKLARPYVIAPSKTGN